MLDQETKRKINRCRDVLVGKIPTPNGQVDQITIALMYKFMDDMDKEAEEMGGRPSFFTGEYAQYSWSKIFDPRLGGNGMIGLYSEALKIFLKEINEFNYDHSEQLGDAFEYLLSVLGTQGEAGQFRTPRHIIDFIVEIVEPKKNETILDPACGTAGFLISSYKHILKSNTKNRNGDKLTPDERKRLIRNFTGYD